MHRYDKKVFPDYNIMIESRVESQKAMLTNLVRKPDLLLHEMEEGALQNIFPELYKMKGLIGRGIYHQEDVWDHSLEVYKLVATFSGDADLLLAALLHDYGKPSAYNPETKRFSNHEEVGATLLAPILNNVLELDSHRQARIYWLVRFHMWDRDGSRTDKKKKWWSFFSMMQMHRVTIEEFMILRYSDFMGRKTNGDWMYRELPYQSLHSMWEQDNVKVWWDKYVVYMLGGLVNAK